MSRKSLTNKIKSAIIIMYKNDDEELRKTKAYRECAFGGSA